MKRLLSVWLCVILLLTFAGCDGDTPEQPTGGTTTVATTATTTATAGETTTTTGETTATTTTTTTKTPTTTTTQAPTTAKPTTTTEAPTTTTKPPVTDTALQIGGPTFTLDGVTFEMGTSPEKLLAHLGEPKEKQEFIDSLYGQTHYRYHYENIIVETGTEYNPPNEFIHRVYFFTDYYSFDGIAVGITVEELDNKVFSKFPKVETMYMGYGFVCGPCRVYESAGKTNWYIYFPKVEPPYTNEGEVILPTGSQVRCIEICYMLY